MCEALEPRLLLSADAAAALAAPDDPDAAHDGALEQAIAALEPVGDGRPSQAPELVFIDTAVEDYGSIVEDLLAQAGERSFEIHLLEGDGVAAISAALAEAHDVAAVHVISHGDSGVLQLGDVTLDGASLSRHAEAIAGWADALAVEADLLFYGCDVAATADGRALLESLARLTGADVAGSTDLTGNADLGGDWELEHAAGTIETGIALTTSLQAGYAGTLDIVTGLTAHYRFDVNASDSLGSFNGTLIGNASIDTTDATQKVGEGKLDLDGTGDYVNLSSGAGYLNTVGEGTIAVWVRTASADGNVVWSATDSGDADSRVEFGLNASGQVYFKVAEAGVTLTDIVTTDSYNDGTWHHMAVTVDATEGAVVYVDGRAVGSDASNAFFNDVTNLDSVHIGASRASSALVDEFNGQIDDVRFYTRALTADDVTEVIVETSDLVVDTTSDAIDGATGSIGELLANKGADGRISLREAITAANGSSGFDAIRFEIADALIDGAHTIEVGSHASASGIALPDITDALIIDGSTDADFAGSPIIEIDGSSAGAGATGLTFTAGSDGSTLRGVAVHDFAHNGVLLQGGDNIVAGNYLGIDADGSTARGNATGAVAGTGNLRIESADNDIGGLTAADGNVISASGASGVVLFGAGASGNLLRGNLIGLDATGSLDRGNAGAGIEIDGAGANVIGGTTAAARNVITGNDGDGISITAGDNNIVQGNYIGTDSGGTVVIGNLGDGIALSADLGDGATGNLIGGVAAGAGNVIRGAGVSGVAIRDTESIGNSILGNAIYDSAIAGIDLGGDGPTANDAGDADPGPNNLLNTLIATNVTYAGGNTTVDFTLDAPAGTYRVEFFLNGTAHVSGYGEGETLVHTTSVVHTGGGSEAFSTSFATVTGGVLSANEKSVLEDIDADLRRDLDIHLVSTIEEVVDLALEPAPVGAGAPKAEPQPVT